MHADTLKRARILIADDQPANVHLLERLLNSAGYTHIASTTDACQILPLFGEFHPDLLLLDLLMPQLDGFTIMEQLQPLVSKGPYFPILVLTADVTPETRRRARIVRTFLALARQRPPERQEVYLNLVVDEALDLVSYALRTDGVEVTLELADDLPVLWADVHQLHQVLVNLITNGHHAMREKSELRVLTIKTESNPSRSE